MAVIRLVVSIDFDIPAEVPTEDPDFDMPAFAPDLVVPRPWWWGSGRDPHYCVLPFRVCRDRRFRKRAPLLLVFVTLCAYTSKLGITYVSQERICDLTGFDKADVSRDLKELEAWGYVKRLRSGSKRTHHALRRLVTYDGPDQPIPKGEVEMNDFRVPWMFRDRFINQAATNEGGNTMNITSTRKIEEPVTQDEIGQQQYDLGVAEEKLVAESTRLAHYFADRYAEREQRQTQGAASVATARKLLRRGFTVAELCAHIDEVIAAVPKDERLPWRLADYRAPE